MPRVIYREAGKSDVPAMARIRALTWGTEDHWKVRITAYMDRELHPRQALMARVSYVALNENLVVGLIAGHLTQRFGCEGELQWIDVIPERRGSGVAAGLLRHLAAWFAEQKARRICVDVDPANAAARRSYTRHGAEELNPHWLVWNDIKIALDNKR